MQKKNPLNYNLPTILPQMVSRLMCSLDGHHVVFGRVIGGYDVVRRIEQVGSRAGNTTVPVIISDCGEMRD